MHLLGSVHLFHVDSRMVQQLHQCMCIFFLSLYLLNMISERFSLIISGVVVCFENCLNYRSMFVLLSSQGGGFGVLCTTKFCG